jgi:hypothetical protein
MIALLFTFTLAQLDSLNGNQIAGGSAPTAPQVPELASKAITRRNPNPFPGNIPLPPPAGICNVNSQVLVTAAQKVSKSCSSDCSSDCVGAVRDFQTRVFECESTSEAQRKLYVEQLDVKVKAQEAYCGTLTASSASTTSTTTTLNDYTSGTTLTLTRTAPLRTLTGMPKSSGIVDGLGLGLGLGLSLLTILFT